MFAAVTGKKIVKYDGYEVHNLNELEYVKGEVWANIWQVIIMPLTFIVIELRITSWATILAYFGPFNHANFLDCV